MSCKLESKLYKDLDNNSNIEISSRASELWNMSQTSSFKAKFGDWQNINELAGKGAAHKSRIQGYVDENGEPTMDAFLQTLEQEDVKPEEITRFMGYLGVEFEEHDLSKAIKDMQSRVKRRLNRLRQTKMAPEALLGEQAKQEALENATPEEQKNILREIYRRKYYTDLKNLREQITKLTDNLKILEYLKTINKLMGTAEQQLEIEGALDFESVAEYNTRLALFTGLEELVVLIEENPILKNFVTQKDPLTGEGLDLGGLLARKASLELKFNKVAIDLLANKWGNTPGKMAAIALREFGDAYENFSEYKRNSDLTGKELKAAYIKDKAEYVANMMELNKEEIRQREVNHIKQLLSNDPKDLGRLHSIVLDPRNINNDLISIAVELLDIADYNVMRETVNKSTELYALWKDYIKGKDTKDQRKLYNNMVAKDKDGNLTKYLVGKIKREFWEERKKQRGILKEVADDSPKGTLEYEAAKGVYDKWMKENTIKWDYETGEFEVIDKWNDPQYEYFENEGNKEQIEYKMYWFFREMIEERDSNYPQSGPVGRGLRLPAVQKTLMEQTFENGVVPAMREIWKDTFKVRATDIDYHVNNHNSEEVKKWNITQKLLFTRLDEHNKVQENIPVYYRRDDLVTPEEQSYDLASILLMDYWGSVNYSEKSMVAPELEVLRSAVGSDKRKVTPNHWGKKKAEEVSLDPDKKTSALETETVSGKRSNTYFALESLISSRLYGVKSLGSPKANKIASSIMGWTGDVMLMANYYSAVASVNQAKTLAFIEAGAGVFYGVDFGASDIFKAELKYSKEASNGTIFADMGRIRPQAKTNLLGERFQAMQDWSVSAKRFMAATGLSQVFDKDALHGLHGMGEHYIQHTLMYSFMNAVRVRNTKGEYINVEGKVVEEREKAMTMDEMYEIKDGALTVKEGLDIGEIEFKTGRIIKGLDTAEGLQNAEFRVKDALLELNYYINGNYDANNLSHFQRTIAGKAVSMMRKWFVPGAIKRYRGSSSVFTAREDLTHEDLYYSRHSEDMSYGQYVETVRFVRGIFKKTEDLSTALKIQDNWHKLSAREKAAIHRTISELTNIFLHLGFSSLLIGVAADEPDEKTRKFYMHLAFFSRRVYSESFAYLNPLEAIRIMRSPAASVSMVENLLEFMGWAFTDIWDGKLERYAAGKRKGKTKIGKELSDIFPVWNQLDRDIEGALGFLGLQ